MSIDVEVEVQARRREASRPKTVAVYGMGYVGLTLAYTFADVGIPVVGIDSNAALLEQLKRFEAPFFEKGLGELIHAVARKNPLQLATSAGQLPADIHVVSVGTPVRNKAPDFTALRAVCQAIAQTLKPNDAVILRSTVQTGATRGIVLPILESCGLKGGRDFSLAFAPERTAEGTALEELRTLPQIVGGLDRKSTKIASELFSRITETIIEMASLEAAEMVKLINNTFRDLVFSFANETALICDSFNMDAFTLIQAANQGYPRNPIPLPSPGVAGSCLTKDPYLYSLPLTHGSYKPALGLASRSINERGTGYVMAKLNHFCAVTGQNPSDLRILLLGLAFKGYPETSDYRDSVALDLLKHLPNPAHITVKDFVIADADIAALGYAPAGDLAAAVSQADAVLVMNNHQKHTTLDAPAALKISGKPVFFFDGWHQFDRAAIERVPDAYYSTMGYMTARF